MYTLQTYMLHKLDASQVQVVRSIGVKNTLVVNAVGGDAWVVDQL